MAGARVLHWNGKDIPEELRELPAGTYVVEAVDEAPSLTSEEEPAASASTKLVARWKRTNYRSGSSDDRFDPAHVTIHFAPEAEADFAAVVGYLAERNTVAADVR